MSFITLESYDFRVEAKVILIYFLHQLFLDSLSERLVLASLSALGHTETVHIEPNPLHTTAVSISQKILKDVCENLN